MRGTADGRAVTKGGEAVTDNGDRLTDRERGKLSREGMDTDASRHPIKDSSIRPDPAGPAEDEMNPPTHPSRIGGLGQAAETENAEEAPVPQGHPSREGDDIDNQ
jgi:hypothetical protein